MIKKNLGGISVDKIGILYNKNDLKSLALAEQLYSELKEDLIRDGENNIASTTKNFSAEIHTFEDGSVINKMSIENLTDYKLNFDTLYIEEETSKMFNRTIMFKLFNDKSKGNTYIFNEHGRKNFGE